jgi:N-acetylmuramoyl-L-alanine amidase
MKRLLLALLPLLALASAAYGQARPAEVHFTHHPAQDGAFRVLDECFVPLAAVEAWGWTVRAREGIADIDFDGQTLRIPTRTIGGQPTIALRAAVEQLGGETAWIENSNRLEVLAKVRSVRVLQGKISIKASLPIKPNVFVLPAPPRVVIDIPGARLDSKALQEIGAATRVGHHRPNVVRVVIETPLPLPTGLTIQSSRSFELSLGAGHESRPDAKQDPARDEKPPTGTGASPPVTSDPPVVNPPGVNPPVVNPPVVNPPVGDPPVVDPLVVTPPTEAETPPAAPTGPPPLVLNSESATTISLTLRLNAALTAPTLMRRPEPNRLEFVVPGATIVLPTNFKLNTESIRSVTATPVANGTLLAFELARPMGAEFSASGPALLIQLVKPAVGNGRLAGKIVVVDPGHGGRDSGAAVGGVREKDLNLSISKILAQRLAAEGATVIMTRKTDDFVALQERAQIANRNKADLFLSVHINSNKNANSTSGTITFFHKKDSVGQLLADCIQREIAKVSGLPSIGVWSDQRIYDSGFAVLRHSTMPGVLIEVGFINHNRDRARMVLPEFQNAVAGAVVQGVKVFLGDVKSQTEVDGTEGSRAEGK